MALSRRDVGYTVISRFEESFRGFLAKKLVGMYADYLEGIPPAAIENAKERSSVPTWEGSDDLLQNTDFSNLCDIVRYKGMYRRFFPDLEYDESRFQEIMQDLYELRCNIAHVRNLTSGQPP